MCAALLHHPTYMKWFSTTQNLELCGFPLAAEDKNPTRREYLRYCRHFARFFGLCAPGVNPGAPPWGLAAASRLRPQTPKAVPVNRARP